MEPNKELEQAIENKFLTPSKFALEIEKIVAEEMEKLGSTEILMSTLQSKEDRLADRHGRRPFHWLFACNPASNVSCRCALHDADA